MSCRSLAKPSPPCRAKRTLSNYCVVSLIDWPIPINVERLADVAIPHDLQRDFGFKPEEDRIGVSRLLNLTEDQPWGVFLFEFKTKRAYLSHLRLADPQGM